MADYLYALHACWRTTPTGNPLFDKFALAMRDRNVWRLYRQPYFGMHEMETPLIPYSQALSWRGEFGQDPKYWQLLSVLLEGERHRDPEHATSQVPEHTWQPLQESVDEGIADSETYLLLYLARLAELGLKHTGRRVELQGLLEGAENLDPANGYVHYLKALACVNLEGPSDRDAFLSELQLAASAPKFIQPQYYPESFIRDNMPRQDSLPGNKVLCGVVLASTYGNGIDTMWLNAAERGIGQELEAGEGIDLFMAYFAVLARRCKTPDSSLGDILRTSMSFQNLVPQYVTGIRSQLHEGQRGAMRDLLIHSGRFRLACAQCARVPNDAEYPHSPLRALLLSAAQWNFRHGRLPPNWIIEPAVWEHYASLAESEADWDFDQWQIPKRQLAYLTGFDYLAIHPAPEAEGEAKPHIANVNVEIPNPCMALPKFESLNN